MDIASAQWTFNQIGRLNRIDLRLSEGIDVEAFRRALARRLPAGVVAVAPQVERDRAVTVTRAYRVNLNMLALVALWTGAFLVFSTQSLSVLRRRRSLALLRALGRNARPIAARAHRRGRRTRRRRFAARRHSRLVRCRCHPALPDRRSRQRPIAGGGRIHARRAVADAGILRDGNRSGKHRRLAAGALRGAPTPGAFPERRRRRLRAGDPAQRVLRRRAIGPRRRCYRAFRPWADCRYSAMPPLPPCCSARCCWFPCSP